MKLCQENLKYKCSHNFDTPINKEKKNFGSQDLLYRNIYNSMIIMVFILTPLISLIIFFITNYTLYHIYF